LYTEIVLFALAVVLKVGPRLYITVESPAGSEKVAIPVFESVFICAELELTYTAAEVAHPGTRNDNSKAADADTVYVKVNLKG
jgi:hypothetical protein